MSEKPKPEAAYVESFYRDMEILHKVISVYQAGMVYSSLGSDILDVTGAVSDIPPDERERVLEEADAMRDFAKSEEANGMRHMLSLATTRLWGILETMVDDCVVELFLERTEAIDFSKLNEVQISFGEFVRASGSERAALLLDRVKQQTKAKVAIGVGRFENILTFLGLGGPIDEDVRAALLYLSQVRNILVHRGGIVDAKFIERVPGVGAVLGEPVPLTTNSFERCRFASQWYVLELERRIRFAKGDDASAEEHLPRIQGGLLKQMLRFELPKDVSA